MQVQIHGRDAYLHVLFCAAFMLARLGLEDLAEQDGRKRRLEDKRLHERSNSRPDKQKSSNQMQL